MYRERWMAYRSRAIWLVFELGSEMLRKKRIRPVPRAASYLKWTLGFPIYSWALTVNMLQLNTHSHSAAIHSFCQLQQRDSEIIETCQLSLLLSFLSLFLVHQPINISEWFAKKTSPWLSSLPAWRCLRQIKQCEGKQAISNFSYDFIISTMIRHCAAPSVPLVRNHFCWNHPTFFSFYDSTSQQWSVDWQDCGFQPSASICYSHLPQSLTRELSPALCRLLV